MISLSLTLQICTLLLCMAARMVMDVRLNGCIRRRFPIDNSRVIQSLLLFIVALLSQKPLHHGLLNEEDQKLLVRRIKKNKLHSVLKTIQVSIQDNSQWHLYISGYSMEGTSQAAPMVRDGLICYGEDAATKVLSKVSKAPLYYYRFAYQGRYSWVYYPGTTTPYGVVHMDDLIYLFNISTVFPSFNSEDPETKTVERMTTLWVNFAKTGNPTPRKTELLQNVIWEPFTNHNLKYMDIGSNLQMKSGLHQDTLPVWNELLYSDYPWSNSRTKG